MKDEAELMFDRVISILDRMEELAADTPYQCPEWPEPTKIHDFLAQMEINEAVPFAVWLLKTAPLPQTEDEKASRREVKRYMQSWLDEQSA